MHIIWEGSGLKNVVALDYGASLQRRKQPILKILDHSSEPRLAAQQDGRRMSLPEAEPMAKINDNGDGFESGTANTPGETVLGLVLAKFTKNDVFREYNK